MYVDDFLDSADSLTELNDLKSNVESVLKRGGFKIKHWLDSGVLPTEQTATIFLPNALEGNESTALGLGYNVQNDSLYVRSSVNFSKKIQKMRTGPNLCEQEIERNFPSTLTKRMVLAQLMGTFDPCGLISPFKMKGSIHFS